MKFIELTPTFGLKKIVNAVFIVSIDEHVTPSETYTQVEFSDGEVMKCKNSYAELCTLLEVDTVERRIERLKQENFKIRMQDQYNTVFSEYIGGKTNGQ